MSLTPFVPQLAENLNEQRGFSLTPTSDAPAGPVNDLYNAEARMIFIDSQGLPHRSPSGPAAGVVKHGCVVEPKVGQGAAPTSLGGRPC